MKAHPTYNLFLYGISDENNEFLGKPATEYADTFVSNLLYSPSSAPVSPDAMVAVTIWMQVIHSLHSAHAACNKPSYPAGESTGDEKSSKDNDPALHIDEAAAYWIGDNQAATGSSQGHLLYALTESISSQFEEIPEGAESEINVQIIDLLNQVSAALLGICPGWFCLIHTPTSDTIMLVRREQGKKSHRRFSGLYHEFRISLEAQGLHRQAHSTHGRTPAAESLVLPEHGRSNEGASVCHRCPPPVLRVFPLHLPRAEEHVDRSRHA